MIASTIRRLSQREHFPAILGTVLTLLYVAPMLILGTDSQVLVHDYLDDLNWFSNVLLAQNPDAVFAGPDRVIDSYMGGLPRDILPSQWMVATWLYQLFPPFTAHVLMELLLHLTAFWGMFVLLRSGLVLKQPSIWIVVGVAVAFAWLPYLTSLFLTIPAQPWVLYAYLRLRQKPFDKLSIGILAAYPFVSHFIIGGIFLMILGALVFAWDMLRRRICWSLFTGLAVMSATAVFVNYRLFRLILFSGFVSQRADWPISLGLSLGEALAKGVSNGITGQYHAASLQFPFIWLAIALAGIMLLWLKPKPQRFWQLTVAIGAISLFYGLWGWQGLDGLKAAVPILSQFQLSRFHFLHPLLWYLLLAQAAAIIWAHPARLGRVLVLGILLLQCLRLLTFQPELRPRLVADSKYLSYKKFRATTLFDQIKTALPGDIESYRVASLGLHPTIAAYNGFRTIDGYAVAYPLAHKRAFRPVLAPEFAKSAELARYFDLWGSRCYLLSSELGKNYLYTKDSTNIVQNLALNTQAMTDLGCRYIFSAVEIANAPELGLELLGTFDQADAAWRIRVYGIGSGVSQSTVLDGGP